MISTALQGSLTLTDIVHWQTRFAASAAGGSRRFFDNDSAFQLGELERHVHWGGSDSSIPQRPRLEALQCFYREATPSAKATTHEFSTGTSVIWTALEGNLMFASSVRWCARRAEVAAHSGITDASYRTVSDHPSVT